MSCQHHALCAMEVTEVPRGRIPAQDFARDFAARIRAGGPAEITVLARNSTERLLRGREPKTGEHYPTQGQVALYYGIDVEGFAATWAGRGLIAYEIDPQRPPDDQRSQGS